RERRVGTPAQEPDDRPEPRRAPSRRRSAGAGDPQPGERPRHQLAVPRAAHERRHPLGAGPAEEGELLAVPEGEGEGARAGGGEGGIDDEREPEGPQPGAHQEAQERAGDGDHFFSLASSSLAGAYSLLASRERSSIWRAFLSSPWRWLMSAR